ncbi:hypothetical protein [Alkalilimnicola ehrlichii]|uniref:hypothetical protein n=1 Tax=Alkalilimnicola ehrlichii TaxID=351052 RepID=UPI0011C069EF|nr:hypothetical protein [Alkalilimnicola ehrlichii]
MSISTVAFLMTLASGLSSQSLAVGGVDLSMQMEDVVSAFGEPLRTESAMDWYDHVHIYEDFSIHTVGGQDIVGIESDSEGVCLGDGVCVGDVWDEELLADSGYEDCCDRVYPVFNYWKPDDNCRYLLAVEGSKVVKVAGFCSP